MPLAWAQRKNNLCSLLGSSGDEVEEGHLLDTLLFQKVDVIDKSLRSQIETLKFKANDVKTLGTLAYGQFGTVELVNCAFDNQVYVLKRMEKRRILRVQDQCSPSLEREVFLRGLRSSSPWIPAMLCAFQDDKHLSIVMQYAEGGSLWDVMESLPDQCGLPLKDLKWWIPQCVSAISWCHSQGFIHRDIKPHNFVFKSDNHVLLVDFGSVAPLLDPLDDGVQFVPYEFCAVPCGTCDYISPEVLQAHEEALVRLEITSEGESSLDNDESTADFTSNIKPQKLIPKSKDEIHYGREADWWSLGAMMYEMAFGVAPFFARDIRQTYIRIMEYESSLKLGDIKAEPHLIDLLKGLLCSAEKRLGRHSVEEIQKKAFFMGVQWDKLQHLPSPVGLHLPLFTYSSFINKENESSLHDASTASEETSNGFTFSALFQSSQVSIRGASEVVTKLQGYQVSHNSNIKADPSVSHFVGFSWGPTADAFDYRRDHRDIVQQGPGILSLEKIGQSPLPRRDTLNTSAQKSGKFDFTGHDYTTPIRPFGAVPGSTVPRTSAKRTSQRRALSDREAMRQLVECVTMSAKRRVIASGRKPKILGSRTNTLRRGAALEPISDHTNHAFRPLKALRFDEDTITLKREINVKERRVNVPDLVLDIDALTASSDAETEIFSPSPSPRPGSAMSMSMFDRALTTPTSTVTLSQYLLNPEPNSRSVSPSSLNNIVATSSYLLEDISVSLADGIFGQMEQRHAKLLSDLQGVQRRLDGISVQVRRPSE